MKENIGQLYLAGFNGREYNAELEVLLEKHGIGSFILFEKNIPDSREALKRLISDINDKAASLSLPRPLIAIDHEGGRVHRLKNLATRFPPAGHTAHLPDEAIVEIAFQQAQELLYFGFNMIIAPVLDVCSRDAQGAIGARSFSGSPSEAARRGLLAMEGFRRAGILAVPKHFPGHGDIPADPHFGMAVVEKNIEEFERCDIVPFKSVIEQGADVIMTAHILTPNVDGRLPATLSRRWVDYLRTGLGFKNVVMTDDLCMKAIWDIYSVEEMTGLAVRAGLDLFTICFNDGEFAGGLERAYRHYEKMISEDSNAEKQFHVSLERIRRLKHKLSAVSVLDDESIFEKGKNLLAEIVDGAFKQG